MNITQLERALQTRAKLLEHLYERADNRADHMVITIRRDITLDMAEVLRLCRVAEAKRKAGKVASKAKAKVRTAERRRDAS